MPPPQTPRLPGKPRKKKPVAEWQRWEKRALDRRFMVLGVVVGLAGLFLAIKILPALRSASGSSNVTTEAKPELINSRPPEFVQPFSCDVATGAHAGRVRLFLKNMGNFQASGVIPTLKLRLVPEQSTGNAEVDTMPVGDCTDTPFGIPARQPVQRGEESVPELFSLPIPMPSLLSGDGVSLYGVSCVYYGDRAGSNHAACDTYRFSLANGDEIFRCDGQPKVGKFEETSISNCAH